jgi:uracil phosphoribosyltransferase
MVHHLCQTHSILNTYIQEMRDVQIQQDRWRFRQNIKRIGNIIAYEISKQLEYQKIETQTPLGISESYVLSMQPIVATILRAGIPLHEGILEVFDRADNAFIGAYRKHHPSGAFDIKLDYIASPALENRTLILCDPMLATGASIIDASRALIKDTNPAHIHIVSIIASTEGIDYVEKHLDNFTIWTAAIDQELTAKGYIVPGLGDAGDLAFGEKSQF